jgi:hypothetical protein
VKLGQSNADCVCKWVLRRRLEKTAQRGASRCVLIAKKCSSDCNKKGDGLGMWHVWEKQQLHTGFWWENLRERSHLEDVDDDGKIILKWIFEKKRWKGVYRIYVYRQWDKGAGCCEHGNEHSGSTKKKKKKGNFVSSGGHAGFSSRTLVS